MLGNGTSQKPDYGLDAPRELKQFLLIGLIGLALGGLSLFFGGRNRLVFLNYLALPLIFVGLSFLATAIMMIWGSRVRKFSLRDQVIDSIPWRGDETVLDIGCGHGLMLIGAAKKLDTGHAIGIDLWSQSDQAFNSPEAVQRNARIEGVTERIEIRRGDARALAIPDESVDTILSSWVLHNIEDQSGRDQAVREMARVLKPGGRLVLVDISYSHHYATILKESGLQNVRISRPDYLFVVPTHRVEALKPFPAPEPPALSE